jgi:hypothetical protein
MLSFIQYLTLNEETTGQGIDASGKLFELHTMRHLLGGKHPTHYRDDELGHPAAAAETLRGRVTPEEHDKVDNSSKLAAERIKEHIKDNHPGFRITKTTWTSNKTDLQKFHDEHNTGGTQSEQDNADYIISLKHPKTGEVRHIGISSKYTSAPTARSPGLQALSSMAKIKHDDTQKIVNQHSKKIDSTMGFTNQSEKAKADVFRGINEGGSKAQKSKKQMADGHARARGEALATHFHKAFSAIHLKNTSARNAHFKNIISTLSGEGGRRSIPTVTLKTDKNKVPSIKKESSTVDQKLDQMKSFHTKAAGNRVHFYGIHRDTGEVHHLGTLELRSKSVNSSPHIPYQGFKSGTLLKKA